MLLVWSANIIKLYACTKRLGVLEVTATAINSMGSTLNLDEVQRIQARTKIMVRKEIEGMVLDDELLKERDFKKRRRKQREWMKGKSNRLEELW